MTEDLWINGQPDPLDTPGVKTKKPRKQKPAPKDFLLAGMARLALGLDARGKVWADLLQQQRMHPRKPIVASNVRLARLGVGRFAKTRALRSLERAKLIRVLRGAGHNPRVKLLK